MSAFERAKKVWTDIVCLQEPYVGGDVLARPAQEIRWGTVGEWKKQKVAIGIAITRWNRIIVEARADIIKHSYIQALDLWELEKTGGKKKKRTVNRYNNHLQEDHVWTRVGSNTRRIAMADTDWDSIIEDRVIILGDFMAHSPEWNPYVGERRDAASHENPIETHDLIMNNETGVVTGPTGSSRMSIIDLTFTTPNIVA